MECLHPLELPVIVDGKRYKNYHLVPCGKCYACKERIQKDWIFRLQQELRQSRQAVFATFTYDDENLDLTPEGVPTVCKRTVQLYVKRLRKRLPSGSLRYYFCSEYGSNTLRPHYHAILFNYSEFDLRDLVSLDWELGFVYLGTVTDSSIAYVTKYVLKDGKKPPGADETFALMSTRPALGSAYVEDPSVLKYHKNHPFLTLPDGTKRHLPRYYRTKIEQDHFNLERSDPAVTLEDQFYKIHPNGTDRDFQIWRHERIRQYEINKLKRSKNNSKI